MLTISLPVTRTCVNFYTVYNDTLVAKGLKPCINNSNNPVIRILKPLLVFEASCKHSCFCNSCFVLLIHDFTHWECHSYVE